MLDSALLNLLVCPSCKGKLFYDHEKQELICRFDQLAYPVVQDVPMLLIDSARKIDV